MFHLSLMLFSLFLSQPQFFRHHQQQQQHHPGAAATATYTPPQLRSNRLAAATANITLNEADKLYVSKKVLQCDGSYVTLRMATRKIGRYPSAIVKDVIDNFLSRSPDDGGFVGISREVYQSTHRTVVFYKCPPNLLPAGHVEIYDMTMAEYALTYSRPCIDAKTGQPERKMKSLQIIENNSPFQPGSEVELALKEKLQTSMRQNSIEGDEEEVVVESLSENLTGQVDVEIPCEQIVEESDHSVQFISEIDNESMQTSQARDQYTNNEAELTEAVEAAVVVRKKPETALPDFSQIAGGQEFTQETPPIPSMLVYGDDEETSLNEDFVDASLGAEEYI